MPTSGLHRSTPIVWKEKAAESCVVDSVVLTAGKMDYIVAKITVRSKRRPELGDKFSSRHGQKGVVGNIIHQEDMPFSEYGMCPDLVMNPHGLPSRMTVGNMIELVGAKAALLSGDYFYGTAFGKPSGSANTLETINQTVIGQGFSYSGKDFLSSGITGEPLEYYIFIGPIYYQKLKHMVLDKIYARRSGPRVLLTRQPTEGRSADGGLRVGEMERDCLVGYGAAQLLLERLMISSDRFVIHVCTNCRVMGFWHKGLKLSICSICKTSNNIVNLPVPYASKLLFQELQAMNIVPKLTIAEP